MPRRPARDCRDLADVPGTSLRSLPCLDPQGAPTSSGPRTHPTSSRPPSSGAAARANSLVAADTCGLRHDPVDQCASSATIRVGRSCAGVEASGVGHSPSLSCEGRVVAFVTGLTQQGFDPTRVNAREDRPA